MDELLYNCIKSTSYYVSNLFAPQNSAVPYVVFGVVSDNKLQCLEGNDLDYIDMRYQVDIYDDDMQRLESIKSEIINKIVTCTDFTGTIETVFNRIEDDTKLIHGIIDFTIS